MGPPHRRIAVALLVLAVAGCGGSGTQRRTATPTATAAAGLAVVSHRRLDERLEEWNLRSPALADPTRVRVLVPAGYRRHRDRRFPVLYLLHGAEDDYRAWTRSGGAEAITAGAPLVVVMPDGGADGWYTNWFAGDRKVRPRWEDYHVGELVPWVDAHYRTVADRRGRAIAGLSMGGYGALTYAGRHPGTFGAVASFSGALEIGSEAALGPRDGEPARWRARLPIELAPRLRSLGLIVLRTGDGTPTRLDDPGTRPGCPACALEGFLRPSNVRLHRRLDALGIRHVWVDRPGTHDWPYWRRDLRETLPALVRVLGR